MINGERFVQGYQFQLHGATAKCWWLKAHNQDSCFNRCSCILFFILATVALSLGESCISVGLALAGCCLRSHPSRVAHPLLNRSITAEYSSVSAQNDRGLLLALS